MLTLESRMFPVLGEVSYYVRTLPNRKEMEQKVTMTLCYYLNIFVDMDGAVLRSDLQC